MNIKIIFLSLLFTILIFSCAKESTNGGIFKVRFTFSPPLQNSDPNENKLDQFLAEYTNPDIKNINVIWQGFKESKPLTSIETPEVSVLSGQNITLHVMVANGKTIGCKTVKIEGILNNKVSHNFTKVLGFSGNSTPCKDGYDGAFAGSEADINFPIK